MKYRSRAATDVSKGRRSANAAPSNASQMGDLEAAGSRGPLVFRTVISKMTWEHSSTRSTTPGSMSDEAIRISRLAGGAASIVRVCYRQGLSLPKSYCRAYDPKQ